MTTAGGQTEYSRTYTFGRGGMQGTILMPCNFLLLMQYVLRNGDPGRKHMLGPGEKAPPHQPDRCKLCARLYPVWMQREPDGYCRPCQLIRALPHVDHGDGLGVLVE